jgi:signal transduction histidine kinase/DNA-binding response OmpR family regulator
MEPGITRVLLVDDQPKNLLALEAVLGGMGLDLVRAQSGEEALREVLDGDFAVILMDVQMPGMDGFETAELIRQRDRSRHTPIIYLTAFQNTESQVFQGYALGAVDFLFKPIVPGVLQSKVAVFVELHRKAELVKWQAAELVENQRREHDRKLADERRRWELERLREEAARERKLAGELATVRDELAAQLSDMSRLHDLVARLSGSLDLTRVLEEVLAAITGLQGTDRGVLLLRDPERGTLTAAASVGFAGAELSAAVGGSPGATDAAGGDTILSGDAEPATALAPYLPAAGRAGCRASRSTPLRTSGGESVAIIVTFFQRPHDPAESETRLVELYARQAAESIDNARLYLAIREADRKKNEFLAMLAHELRNPLAPLLNSLYMLRSGRLGGPEAGQVQDIAERQARHLVRLVDDLLDVSRIHTGKIQLRTGPVDLREAVARAAEAVRSLIEARRLELTLSLPDEPLPLTADAARLEQVLANLLNNAAKYTEPGGRITVEARREREEVVVRIQDTGIGIAPELLPRVFDLFAQAEQSLDRSQGGLGIGLTLVRRLVELHGGSITAASAGVGLGSEFVARLPMASAACPDAAHAGDRRDPIPDGGAPATMHVLVVDDNTDAARVLARLLEARGYQVEVAHDGPAALAQAQARPPDAILLDIGLPGVDGYEVARRLRAVDGPDRALLVALSGYGREEDRQRSREAGMDAHLTKPVDPQTLDELLHRPRPAGRSHVEPSGRR